MCACVCVCARAHLCPRAHTHYSHPFSYLFVQQWKSAGCQDWACRACLRAWYKVHILSGAKAVPCLYRCGSQAKPPDVHVVDRLLAARFVLNLYASCEQHLKDMQQDEQLSKWLKSNTQICPWCSAPVERESGCNSMLCHCGCMFCYECHEEMVDYMCSCDFY